MLYINDIQNIYLLEFTSILLILSHFIENIPNKIIRKKIRHLLGEWAEHNVWVPFSSGSSQLSLYNTAATWNVALKSDFSSSFHFIGIFPFSRVLIYSWNHDFVREYLQTSDISLYSFAMLKRYTYFVGAYTNNRARYNLTNKSLQSIWWKYVFLELVLFLRSDWVHGFAMNDDSSKGNGVQCK